MAEPVAEPSLKFQWHAITRVPGPVALPSLNFCWHGSSASRTQRWQPCWTMTHRIRSLQAQPEQRQTLHLTQLLSCTHHFPVRAGLQHRLAGCPGPQGQGLPRLRNHEFRPHQHQPGSTAARGRLGPAGWGAVAHQCPRRHRASAAHHPCQVMPSNAPYLGEEGRCLCSTVGHWRRRSRWGCITRVVSSCALHCTQQAAVCTDLLMRISFCRLTTSANSKRQFNGGRALVGNFHTLQAVPDTGGCHGWQPLLQHAGRTAGQHACMYASTCNMFFAAAAWLSDEHNFCGCCLAKFDSRNADDTS